LQSGRKSESLSVGTGKENRLFTKKAQIVCAAAKHNKLKKKGPMCLAFFYFFTDGSAPSLFFLYEKDRQI
jgi:hypothetical protein